MQYLVFCLSSVKFTDNTLDLFAFIFIDLDYEILDYEIQRVSEIVVQAVCW